MLHNLWGFYLNPSKRLHFLVGWRELISGLWSQHQENAFWFGVLGFKQSVAVPEKKAGYGTTKTPAVHAPAWKSAARRESGNGSSIYGAQLPGR